MWMYVNEDGNPSREGYYWCTLIAEILKDGKPTGKKVAYGDLRSYDDVTKISEEYRMKGQPREGMGWIRDADGFGSETVYAWSTDVKVGGVCDLPEGIIVIVRTGNDD